MYRGMEKRMDIMENRIEHGIEIRAMRGYILAWRRKLTVLDCRGLYEKFVAVQPPIAMLLQN